MPALSPSADLADPDDLARCRSLLASGSLTFALASRFLPREVRDPATALYAFCRVADDAIDGGDDPTAALAVLHWRLDAIYRGEPLDHAPDRAFAQVVRDHAIPRELPAALLEGFAWDAERRQYETLADLEAYAARVAGTVGAMMALLMGAREPLVLARACDLGVAMQLTNIARDVGEDARAGRLYLPHAWMREAGIEPGAWLERPAFSAALGQVIERLLAAADACYARALTGIAHLPRSCRPSMQAAGRLYAEIGRELERRGLDSVNQRAVVAWARKGGCAARALLASLATPRAIASDDPSPATRFLVEAAVAAAWLPRGADGGEAPRGFIERIVWMLDLFERLERRDREAVGLS
ncbi:MAG: phytoene/squalene synthase family protein [Proteobacteria bacterium]|nr:phytoene/squalene synthase family protein [Pseudomonadota bacterium]